MNRVGGAYHEYIALVGMRERSVRVEPDLEGLRIRVDGEEFHVRWETGVGGEVFLLMNGRPQVVNAHHEGEGRYRIMLGGVERDVWIRDPIASRVGRSSQPILSDRTIEVRSPMHGTIVAIQIAEGDPVEEETPLVVLEAMKMQNAITSPVRGRVREVRVRTGETVEGDALLVCLERSEPRGGSEAQGVAPDR